MSRQKHLSGPFIIDTHELSRRPGSERTVERVEPAPSGLGIDVLGVTAGSDVALHLRLEAVMDGVLATGTAQMRLAGECVRCLDPLDEELVVDLQELYLYDKEGEEPEEDQAQLDGDYLDLEPLLRDAVVLELPINPLCRPDCLGLCPECGFRLLDDPSHAHAEPIDPRWAALSAIAQPDEDDAQPEDDDGTK